MKLSWLFVIFLLAFVALFSVQNAGVITVHFLKWEIQISAALVIQLAALLGAMVGLVCGLWSRRTSKPTGKSMENRGDGAMEKPAEKPFERLPAKPVEHPDEAPLSPSTRRGTAPLGGEKPSGATVAPQSEKKSDAH
jgi:uncharacterized integral membrane protein